MLDVCKAGCLDAIMRGRDEVVDRKLVFAKEGVDMFLVEDSGSLSLGEDEVEEEA